MLHLKYQCPLCKERGTWRIQYGLINVPSETFKPNIHYSGCAIPIDGENRYCPKCELMWRWQAPEDFSLMSFSTPSFLLPQENLDEMLCRLKALDGIPPVIKAIKEIEALLK